MSKTREPYPSETQDRFIVRFPDGMRDRIKAAAEANNRSMNAEIIARLQDSFVAETEFQIGSKITHTPIEQDVLEDAAERGAEKAIRGLIRIADEAHESEPFLDYGVLIRRLFLGLDKDGNPVDYNPPRTPTIPGANAPKGGSKAPKKKGV